MRLEPAHLALLAILGLIYSNAAIADIIPHDQVRQINAAASDLERYYQPMLADGPDACNNYPAVDEWGNVSGGLYQSGAPDGHCRGTAGQVYSRYAEYHGKCAIMYSYYFPKDQPPNYLGAGPGHRHDWENIVVWLNSCQVGASIYKINYSTHGKYSVSWNPPTWTGVTENLSWGVHPKLTYHATYDGFADHILDPSDDWGRNQPLIAWDRMPGPAKNTLNTYDFGAASVPFRDKQPGDANYPFWTNLDKAWAVGY